MSCWLFIGQLLSHVRPFETPWIVARWAPLSMKHPRQEYWSGFPFPYPGDLPDEGSNPCLLHQQVGSFTTEPPGKPREKRKCYLLSHVWLFVTPWVVAHQAPLSMGFSMQKYWNGLPLLSPWDPAEPGIKAGFPALQADSFPTEPPRKPQGSHVDIINCQIIVVIINCKSQLGHYHR